VTLPRGARPLPPSQYSGGAPASTTGPRGAALESGVEAGHGQRRAARVRFAAAAARPGATPRTDRRVSRDGDGVAIVSLPSFFPGILFAEF
jgi:hypothetical protein